MREARQCVCDLTHNHSSGVASEKTSKTSARAAHDFKNCHLILPGHAVWLRPLHLLELPLNLFSGDFVKQGACKQAG